MRVVENLVSFVPPAGGSVVTIGNFDGMHRGHTRIIELLRSVADRLSAIPVAITFEPHPLAVLAPERAPAVLTTIEEKLALLGRCGVERCVVMRSEPALLSQAAEDFLASLVAHCRPRAIVEGPDFNFGKGRTGSIETLRAHADRWGYEVHEVPEIHCAELPTHPRISSSSIRQALLDGRVEEANAMLGRPYRVVGTIVTGRGRGTGLGFPTANLNGSVHLLPQQAVYAAVAQFDDGELHLAAVNVGPQPTFDQAEPHVEAHLLDYAGDLRGHRLGLHFLARLREQQKFAGTAQLAEQIQCDIEAAREWTSTVVTLHDYGVISLGPPAKQDPQQAQ